METAILTFIAANPKLGWIIAALPLVQLAASAVARILPPKTIVARALARFSTLHLIPAAAPGPAAPASAATHAPASARIDRGFVDRAFLFFMAAVLAFLTLGGTGCAALQRSPVVQGCADLAKPIVTQDGRTCTQVCVTTDPPAVTWKCEATAP